MAKKSSRDINLFDCIPEILFTWQENDDHVVVVNMPRFHVAWMQRYLIPKNKSPYIKITLDEFGSHAWKRIDGNITIAEIADSLVEEFGDNVQPIEDRLPVFMRLLKQRGFIRFKLTDGTFLK